MAMKILMVLDREFPPDIRVENEAGMLTKAGHQLSIACYTREGRSGREELNDWKVYRRPISKFTYKSSVGALRFPFYFNFWRKFLGDILDNEKFDAIHVHDLPLARIGYELSRIYGTAFVLDLHENWPYLLETSDYANTLPGKLLSSHSQWKRYEAKMVSKADRVVCVVDEMKERICRKGADPKKVFVVSNTYNLENRIEIKESPGGDKKILFYAGGLTRHRGLQVVIRGMKEILGRRKDVVLWIVGSGKYKAELERITGELGIAEAVIFHGQQPFNTTMEMLAKADIALIPHLRSVQNDCSSPNKLYQYMYFKKALAVSDCISVSRVVQETRSGKVYRFDDPGDFAHTILNMLTSDHLQEYGHNGHTSVLEKYNWQESVIALVELYNSLKHDLRESK